MAIRLAEVVTIVLVGGGMIPAAEPTKTDAFGDPLPEGAVARLGTNRMWFPVAPAPVFLPPEFKQFLALGPDGLVRRYDAASGRPLPGEGFTGRLLGVSADGKRAALLADTGVEVREMETGRVVRAGPGPHASQNAVLSADGKRVAYLHGGLDADAEVHVWEVDGQADPVRLPTGTRQMLNVLLSWDGAVAVARHQSPVTPDGGQAPLLVFDVAAGKERCRVPAPAGPNPPAVAVSPDGGTLAVVPGDGSVELYDARTGTPRATLLGMARSGAVPAFTPDGGLIAVGTDGSVDRWGPDGKPLGRWGRPADVTLYSPPAFGVAAGGRVVLWGPRPAAGVGYAPPASTTWAAWDPATRKTLTPARPGTSAATGIGFPAGNAEVWTAAADGRVSRWDRATGKHLGPIAAGDRPFAGYGRPAVLAAEARKGLYPDEDGIVFDPAAGEPLFTIPRPRGEPGGRAAVVPSADFARAASVRGSIGPGKPGRCDVWDLDTRLKVAGFDLPDAYPGPGYAGPAGGFSPDRTRLVLSVPVRDPRTNEPGQVFAGWDLTTGKKVGEVPAPAGELRLVPIGPGAAVVASAERVWAVDYEAGRVGDTVESFGPAGGARRRGPVGPRPVPPVVVGPGEAWFAVGVPLGKDGGYGVRVYDWPRARLLKTFTGHAGPVTALVVSPDGKTLASGSEDTTVLLWDVDDLAPKK